MKTEEMSFESLAYVWPVKLSPLAIDFHEDHSCDRRVFLLTRFIRCSLLYQTPFFKMFSAVKENSISSL